MKDQHDNSRRHAKRIDALEYGSWSGTGTDACCGFIVRGT